MFHAQTTPVLVNGKSIHSASVFDRGLQYGDGLFETMLVKAEKIPFWPLHRQRLIKGCERLLIPLSGDDLSSLEEDFKKMNQLVDDPKGIIKLIVTRGQSERGYKIPHAEPISRILSWYPQVNYPESYYQQGIQVVICQRRHFLNPNLSGIKHLNRLEQVLTVAEWQDVENISEGIVLDIHDNIISGTMSNIFLVLDGELCTPDLSNVGIEGVMREYILQLSQQLKLPVTTKTIHESELINATEVFLCNSVRGIWPVKKIAEMSFNVGPVTQKLQSKIMSLMN